MALKTKLTINVTARQTNPLDLAAGEVPLAVQYGVALANGTGTGQADRIFHDRRTIAASGTDDLDLAGVLTDAFGATLTFTKIKAIIVSAATGNTNNVVIGAAASNQFVGPFGAATHTLAVRPGGTVAVMCGEADAAGYAVTAATGDLLRVANSGAGTSVTYDIVIIGTSA